MYCTDVVVTIFTATYNRAYLIDRLYSSLKRQTCKNFEWVIVDDCSTDNTKEIVEEWQKNEKDFEIVYYRQKKNGGKHRAWNVGIRIAKGDAFFSCDSDDYLTDDAVEFVVTKWNEVKGDRWGGHSRVKV